jgi:hypothetical protein
MRQGKIYPAGRPDARLGKIPKADGGQAAPSPGLCRQRWGVLVLLVADPQGEVVQGAEKNNVGDVIAAGAARVSPRDMSVLPDENCRGEGIWKLRQLLPGGGGCV